MPASLLRRRALLASLVGPGVAAWAAAPTHAADDACLVTLLDGSARLLDARGSAAAAPGVRVGDTIVQTDAACKLLRLEWPDGASLDLGPGTELLFAPRGLGDRDGAAAAYVMRGWVKLAAMKADTAPQLVNLFCTLQLRQGAVVAFVGDGLAWAFAESGSTLVAERPPRGSALSLNSGQFFQRRGSDPGQMQTRAPAEPLRTVPRAFRDPLPHRYAAVSGKSVEPRRLAPPTFDDLRPWLAGESALRHHLVRHFAHWAQDEALRRELLAHEKDHAEWHGVLHPEPGRKP